MIPTMVAIYWEDHSGGTSSWTPSDDLLDAADHPYMITTVGMIVKENKDRIVVVQNWSVNDMVNHHMTIMKKNIKTIKVLRKGKA